MDHEHKPKITDWGFDEFRNWIPILYGCTDCLDTFVQVPEVVEKAPHDHEVYTHGCFACKIPTLQLGAGDAGRADSMSGKKWDKELSDYRDARAQGIQPAGTSTKQIQQAIQASDTLGKAYSAETMMPAPSITKVKAKALEQLGV